MIGKFFANKWTKRVVSLLSPCYCVVIVYFAYLSVFYKLDLLEQGTACMIATGSSVMALTTMLYTRKQLLTKLASLLILPTMVFPIMIYFGQWGVLVPLAIMALMIFFLSGFGETAKTIWGTMFLLVYLLGALVYFLVTSLFAPATVTTIVDSGTSPSGLYRYEVADTTDSSNGSTKVSVESNTLDKEYFNVFHFKIRGLSHDVSIERPLQENCEIEWKTERREEITEQLNAISEEIEITLSDKQMDLLGRNAYHVTFNNGKDMTISQEEYHKTVIALNEEAKAILKTDKQELKLDSMSEKARDTLGITIENFKTVTLSSLTDEELAKLGIPEEGDVMYYNGKVVFRYYIAILEEYFDISKQELGLM
ncbi:MAG: multidrug effflux MFS transporter [Ruminococcus sp.]|nr:multidrug effflux MFS transporter [Ruminococcus sp.]